MDLFDVPARRVARSTSIVGLIAAGALALAACTGSAASPTLGPPSAGASSPATSGGGGASAVVALASSSSLGPILTGAGGRTLYTFSPDTATTSACTSTGCVAAWPIATVPAGTTPTAGSGVTGTLGTFSRPDGTLQITYNGHQLYFYVGDAAPGDTAGQGLVGFGGTWSVATP